MSCEKYLITESKENQTSRIIRLILDAFLYEEPLASTYFRHMYSEPVRKKEMFEANFGRLLQYLLHNNTCLIAVDRWTNEIVATMFLLSREYQDLQGAICNGTYDRLMELIILFDDLKHEAFHQLYLGITIPVEVSFLAVDGRHRRKGLATRLLRESINLSRSKGANLVYGLFTSLGAITAAERAGMIKSNDTDIYINDILYNFVSHPLPHPLRVNIMIVDDQVIKPDSQSKSDC